MPETNPPPRAEPAKAEPAKATPPPKAEPPKAEPPKAAPAPDPTVALMGQMVRTLEKIQDAGRREPALPTPGLFEAGEGYHVIDSTGQRARHGDLPEGRATYLDEKLEPIPAE